MIYTINDKRVAKFVEAGTIILTIAKINADTSHNIRNEYMDDVSTVSGNKRTMNEGITGWVIPDFIKGRGFNLVKIPCVAEKDKNGFPVRNSSIPCVGCMLKNASFDKMTRSYSKRIQGEIHDLKQLLELAEKGKKADKVKEYNDKIKDKMDSFKNRPKEFYQALPVDTKVDPKILIWFEGESRLATMYGKKTQLVPLAKALGINLEETGVAIACQQDMFARKKFEITLVPAKVGKIDYLQWVTAKFLEDVPSEIIPQEDWKIGYAPPSGLDKEFSFVHRKAVRLMTGSENDMEPMDMDMNLMSTDEDVDVTIENFINGLVTGSRTSPIVNMVLREIGDDWDPVRNILKEHCLHELTPQEVQEKTVAGRPVPKYMFIIPAMKL